MPVWRYETDEDLALDRILEILQWVFPEEIAAGDEAKRIEAETAEAIRLAERREISRLGFSARTYGCLERAGMLSVEKLRNASDEDLLSIRNFGKISLAEVRRKMAARQQEETDD